MYSVKGVYFKGDSWCSLSFNAEVLREIRAVAECKENVMYDGAYGKRPMRPTSLAVHTVGSPALGGPHTVAARVIVDETGRARQLVGNAVHTVEELVANLWIRVSEVSISSWTSIAGLRVLCNHHNHNIGIYI